MGKLNKEAVLKAVQARGPLIPNDIRRELGGENLIIGAILSELADERKVCVTSTKIGGSPAYYTLGTEERLLNLVKHLNPKDRDSVELLKQKKVLKDSDLTPLLRVSLRNIKDFAKPLEVNIRGQKEIYWKWFLIDMKEAEQIIFKKIMPAKPALKVDVKPQAPVPMRPEIKIEVQKPAAEIKKELAAQPKIAEPVKEKEKEKPKEKKERKEKEPKPAKEQPKEEVQRALGKSAEELETEKDSFFKTVWYYFKSNDIQIIDYNIIRKKSEIEFTIAVPSRIGSQEYYCKAKSKAKVSDGDLSSTYVHGQSKKLPVIFLTTGELTKKAKDMLARDFKGMTVKRI